MNPARAFEVVAHDHRVGEIAHHVAQPGLAASRHRDADRDVALPGIAHQQHIERRQQGHEEGGVLLPRQRPQGGGERGIDRQRQGPARIGHLQRPLAVGRQVQGLQLAQVLAPIGELGLQSIAFEAIALPVRAVGEAQRRRGQAGVIAALGVELAEFAADDAHGPSVGHDVVHHQHQDMVVGRDPQQLGTQQRGARKIEGLGDAGADARQQRGLARRLPAELDLPQAEALLCHRRRQDLLPGRIPAGVELGAQAVVARDQRAQAAFEHVRRPGGRDAGSPNGCCRGAPVGHLVEEPQAFLLKGQGRAIGRGRGLPRPGRVAGVCGQARVVALRGSPERGGPDRSRPRLQSSRSGVVICRTRRAIDRDSPPMASKKRIGGARGASSAPAAGLSAACRSSRRARSRLRSRARLSLTPVVAHRVNA